MNKSEKFWNKSASKAGTKYKKVYSRIINHTKKQLSDGDVVMDLGCGTGSMSIDISDSVKEVYGVDSSAGMIDVARKKAEGVEIENIRFIHADIFDERFRPGSFNTVLAFNLLHLLDNTEGSIKRINEVLKEGGLFISTTPCLGEGRFIGAIMKLLSRTGLIPDVKSIKLKDLEDAIIKNNFKIIETSEESGAVSSKYIIAKKIT